MSLSDHSAKERIQDAVYALVCKQSLAQITVTDIIRHAQVSRPTFYRNFPDKYAAANSLYDRHIHELRSTFLKDKDTKALLCSFYRVFYDHRVYYNSLLSDIQAQNSFFNYWEKLNYDQTFAEINHKRITTEIYIAVSLWIHGSMYISWDLIKGNIDCSPEEAAAFAVRNMPLILRELLQVED